ncbi:hypothetical protein BDV93DRAFT_545772 [Ceratobasidium sp. AG-I]|nr:hypothetical protein BDV93DRAFT_545772 [Ceratobasidium sp. AG-I]
MVQVLLDIPTNIENLFLSCVYIGIFLVTSMNPDPQAYDALQRWVDARTHLSKSIQAYVSATTFLELSCTPFTIKLHPVASDTVVKNLEIMERGQLNLQKAQAALKNKRNSFVLPIYALPSELLACIFTTTVAPVPSDDSSNKDTRRSLMQVCSRWRQVALEVCPVWRQVSLVLEINDAPEGGPMMTEIELDDTFGRNIQLPVDQPLNASDAQYTK